MMPTDAVLFVEFYSAYIYTHEEAENGRTVSIAEHVDGKLVGWSNIWGGKGLT